MSFLVVIAVAIARQGNLFAAVMLMGIFSLHSAAIFVSLDAVDVAFTEAAVGAGITVVIMLATIARTMSRQFDRRGGHRVGLAACAVCGGLLFYASFDLPRMGDPGAPAHQHVAPRYIQSSQAETGVPNMVTAVLASYRGYDTLGEVTVIFTAGVSVLALIGVGRQRSRED